VFLGVFLRDAPVRTSAFDVVDVDANLARETSDGWRRRRRSAI
jgi:hypothetical protein